MDVRQGPKYASVPPKLPLLEQLTKNVFKVYIHNKATGKSRTNVTTEGPVY